MKHSIPTKYRRLLAFATLLLLLVSLAGCWKKDDSGSTESSPDTDPSDSVVETTTAPPETTVPETTEAPTATTEAPTVSTEPVQQTYTGTVTTNGLNIREGAGSDYTKLGSYSKGDQIEILEIKNGWGRTSKGWVSMDYVTLDADATVEPTVDTSDDDDTTNEDIVSDGKTTVLGHGVVNLGALNVRSGPGTNYDTLGTVTLGNRYAYYQKSGNWVRIKDGWISLSYFYVEGNTGDGSGTGTTTSALNIRSGPGTAYDKVGTFGEGETVKILTQINSWGYTSKGWISMSYVKMDSSTTDTSTGKGTITATTLNIRKTASADGEKVGTYTKGDEVEILEISGDWGRTNKGWINMDYVDMGTTSSSTTSKSETGTGTVTASSLYIRKKADKTSDTVGAYYKGDKVEILEVSGGWGRTDKGWISLDYVKMDS